MLTTDSHRDDRLRDALRGLRTDTPTETEIDAVLAADDRRRQAPTPAPRRRGARAWRPGMALAATAAAIAIGVTILPGGPTDSASAQVVLGRAAATAAAQPAPSGTPYRYSAIRSTWTYRQAGTDGRPSAVTYTQAEESWRDAEGLGRSRYGAVTGKDATGKPPAWADGLTTATPPGSERRITARGEAAETPVSVAAIPRSANAARAYLDDRYARLYQGRAGAEQIRWERTREVLTILGERAVDPAQRGALFGVLAATGGVTAAGVQKDALGRSGQSVSIAFPGGPGLPEGMLHVVFDPATAALLEWSFLHDGTDGNSGTPDQVHVLTATGWSARQGERPGR